MVRDVKYEQLLEGASGVELTVTETGAVHPQKPPPRTDLDVVQFSGYIFYAEKTEPVLVIDIMRIGKLEGACKVKWATQEGSAKAGSSFKAASGEVCLDDGQSDASIDISILDSGSWEATMEFKVNLSVEKNCRLGTYLGTCRVKVIDNHTFPTSKYKQQLEVPKGVGAGGAYDVGEVALIGEFLRWCYRQQGNAWRTWCVLLLDQLDTLYLWMSIRLQIYLINVVLNHKDPDTKALLFTPDRSETAVIVGLMYVIPMLGIHISELLQASMHLQEHIESMLKASIFRKYLNYNAGSRAVVSDTAVQKAIADKSVALAASYTASLSLITTGIRIGLLLYITLAQHKAHAPFSILVVFVIFPPWGACRLPMLLKMRGTAGAMDVATGSLVSDTCRNYEMISEYMQRPMLNDIFHGKCGEALVASQIAKRVDLNTHMFGRWVGPLCVCVYIARFAPFVMSGDVPLGSFIATIGILKKVVADFNLIFTQWMAVMGTALPLRIVSNILNMPTDLRQLESIFRSRRAQTKEMCAARKSPGTLVDMLPIQFRNVTYRFNTSLTIFKDVNMDVPLGKLVGVVGASSSGKATMLHLLGQRRFPEEGSIFIPTHLRVLHVPQEPMFLNMSAWKNLTLGREQSEVERVIGILEMMKMEEVAKYVREPHQREGDGNGHWLETLSFSNRIKVSLARAFIMNPEILCLHRPMDHFIGTEHFDLLLRILRDHLKDRGLCLDSQGPADTRRVRSCFFSILVPAGGETGISEHLDALLEIDGTGIKLHENKATTHEVLKRARIATPLENL